MLKIQCNYAHVECSKRMKIFDYAIIVLYVSVCVEMKEEKLGGRAARVDSKLNKQFVQMENILIASINCALQIFQVAAKPSVFLLCFVLFINSVVIPIRRVAIHSSRIIVVQFTRNERNERGKKERNANKKTFEWIFAGIVFENNRRLMRKLNAIPNFQLGMHLYEHEVCGDDLLRRALERANSKCFSLF